MPWRELRFVCDAALADTISDALMDAGALSVSVEDADAGTAAEQPLFGEPGSAAEAAWRRNAVVALVDAGLDEHSMVAAAARAAGSSAPPVFTSTDVPDQDWVRLTQSQFDPIRISARLWIVPTWHTAPDPSAIAIRLDPGLAFGTGSHPTTRMCLAWLDQHVSPAHSVLDYGCGSGVLAIAAALLGARAVTATDIDPQALIATRDNAAANRCEVTVYAVGHLPPTESAKSTLGAKETRETKTAAVAAGAEKKADIVVANILTNPLKVLAPALSARVADGGRLTLSGILDSQAQEVIAAYAPFIPLDIWRAEEGWVCLSGEKLPRP